MLGKLLKYDLKWIYRAIVVFYCLSFAFSIIAYFFSTIENSMLFSVLCQFSSGVAVSMIVSSIINCIMRSWARFTYNIYKDESYLTHTLPVTNSTKYLSKVLSAIICTATTIAVAVPCMFICYNNQTEVLEKIKTSLKIAAETFNSSIVNLILVISLVLVLEIICILLVGYSGIIIGHRFNDKKMIKSILIASALYMATNIVSVGVIFIAGALNDNIKNMIHTTSAVNIDSIKTVMLIAIILYIIYNIVFYIIGKNQLSKGVNID